MGACGSEADIVVKKEFTTELRLHTSLEDILEEQKRIDRENNPKPRIFYSLEKSYKNKRKKTQESRT